MISKYKDLMRCFASILPAAVINKKAINGSLTLKNKKDFISNLSIVFIAVLIFGFIGYFNCLFPLTSDDWIFSFTIGDEGRITGISDIFLSQYNYYFSWGGRIIVHSIAQILFLIGYPIADLLNAFVFVLLIYSLYKISNIGHKSNWILFVFLFLGIWFFQAHIPSTIFWLTGSANYLWASVIVLVFVYIYVSYFINSSKNRTNNNYLKYRYLLFILGIFAGCSNENTAIGLIAFLFLLFIYMKYTSLAIPSWMYFGLLGAIVGITIMLVAPGNFIRMESSGNSLSYLDRFFNILSGMGKYFVVLGPVYIVLLVSNYFTKSWNNKIIILSVMFFLVAILSAFSMIASPEFPPRAWFGIIIYMILANGILFANLNLKPFIAIRTLILAICLIGSFIFVRDYCLRISTMKSMYAFWEDRDVLVRQLVEKGDREVVFDETFYVEYQKYDISDLSTEANFWMNNAYARYYGLDSVRVSKDAQMVDMKRYYKRKAQE